MPASKLTDKRHKRPGRRLLVEPTVEQEQESLRSSSKLISKSTSNASSSKSDMTAPKRNRSSWLMSKTSESEQSHMSSHFSATNHSSPSSPMDVVKLECDRSRNKSELSSLLTILFGRLLVVLAILSCISMVVDCQITTLGRNMTSNSTANTTISSDSPSTDSLVSTSANASISSPTISEPKLDNNLADDKTEEATDLEDDDSNLQPDEPEESNSHKDNSALNRVLLDTANSGADLLINRLKPADDTEDSSTSNEEESSTVATSTIKEQPAKRENAPETLKRHQQEAAEELRRAISTWTMWQTTADDVIELFSRKMLPLIVEHGYDVDAGTVTGLLQVFNGIRGLKPWALKLLDASAKLNPGLLVGTQSDFGDFDECLSVRVDDPAGLVTANPELAGEVDPETGLRSATLVGKYCLADVEFPKPPRVRLAERNEELQTDFAPIELRRPLLNFSETAAFKETIWVETGNFFHMLYVDPIRVGICLTNKIDPQNFATVFNKIFEPFRVTINFRDRCITKYDRQVWTSYQVVSAYVLLIACSLVALCTILDLLHTKLNKFPSPERCDKWKVQAHISLYKYRPLFTSFSIICNTKRLFRSDGVMQVSEIRANFPKSANNLSPSASADNSTESSPSIERRSSSISMNGSAANLISNGANSDTLSISTSRHGSVSEVQLSANQATILAREAAGKQVGDRPDINLLCLHGIRVITMTWMIVNHTYLFGGFFVLWAHRRLIDIAEWPKSLSFQLVLNGWLTVETYFFLGAMIVVLNLMPLMRSKRFFFTSYIFHRLLRLMPAYVGLVCLNFLWPLISSGPVWLVKGRSFIQTPCEQNLWTNFLFINNWIWPEKQCMVHTWFLSADFQLYTLAPLVVYLLYRRPVLGHSVNLIVAIIASVISGFVIYANKLMPTTLINKLEFDSIKQQLSYSYFATYQHVGPYCLGIFTGYVLHKRPQIRLPKHLTWLLWLLLPPLSFTTLLLTYLWNGAYDEPSMINPSPLVSALYVAIHRTIWSSLVAWLVFACATGRARILSSFLSHQMFIPLSRLSFSIYLVHLPVIMFRALNLRHTIEWTDSNILWEACGNFIVSLIAAYFLNVVFESPIINLEKFFFGKSGKLPESYAASNLRFHAGHVNEQLNCAKSKLARHDMADNSGEQQRGSTQSGTDDNKSANSSDNLADSSPEQARKLSDPSCSSSSMLACGDSSQSIDSPNQSWDQPAPQHNRRQVVGPNQRRKSLRPKQNSVERIFGQQEEPRNHPHDGDGDMSYSRRPVAPSSVGANNQQAAFSEADSSYSRYDNMYSLGSEYRHYARGGYHQWRMSARPMQYATMSRMEQRKAGEEPNSGNAIWPHDMRRAQHPQRPLAYKPTSSMIQRRQGRYNTLTGIGSREWQGNGLAGYSTSLADDSGHTSGAWMIPRIDSSTLRRSHARASEPSSIVEEENFDEKEDSAL